mmetsp:Transcript_29946/g.45802  ORF Transcript_29946/g.45802 Transcript_29946/m.45802 type:complete len:81 (-) Transcript_29946:200-442(-)
MEKMSRRELQKFRSNHGLTGFVFPFEKRANPIKKASVTKTPAFGERKELNESMDQGGELVHKISREAKIEFVHKIRKLTN